MATADDPDAALERTPAARVPLARERRPRPSRRTAAVRAAAALLAVLSGGQALADEASALRPGSRVRIAAVSLKGPIRGTLAALDDDRLSLETKPGAPPLVIERGRIARLEVSAGRRSRGRGAAIGAALGLGAGLLLTAGVAAGESCEGYGAEDCGLATGISLILFTPALTVSGALIGLALPPPERWVSVPPQAGTRLDPLRGSAPPLALRLVVSF